MSNVRFLGRRAGVAAMMTALGSLIAPTLVTACAGDASPDEDVGKAESASICPIKNPPPGCNPTSTSSSSGFPLPWVEYETVDRSDVSATFGFLTPRGAVIASVTVNLQAYTPTGPTDGLAVGTDATAVESHSIPVNGLVAGTTYRYDVWTDGIDRYTGTVSTLPPVTVTTPAPGMHDPVIAPVVAQAVQSTLGAATTVGFVVGVRRGAVEDLYYFGTTNLVSGPTTYAGTEIAITGGPPTGTTVYELASVTKTLTATLLARYVNDSSLSGAGIHLSDTAVSYLPAAYQTSGWENQITLLELANMSSGLPNQTGFGTVDQLFFAFDYASEAYPPGTSTIYSDLGYSVLGRTLESKLGGGVLPAATPWESLIVSKVAVPLGMPDTVPLVGEVANCGGASPCNYLMSPTQTARLAQNYNCNTNPCTPFHPASAHRRHRGERRRWPALDAERHDAVDQREHGPHLGRLDGRRAPAGAEPVALVEQRHVGAHGRGVERDRDDGDGDREARAPAPAVLELRRLHPGGLDVGAFLLTNSDPGPNAQIVLDILANLPASNLVNVP